MKNFLFGVCVLSTALSSACFAAYREVDLPANDIKFNSTNGMLYAAVPSSAGVGYGNRLVEISPATGAIVRSVFVGSEPNVIGMSGDAEVAWVGLSGAPLVYPVDLSTMTVGTGFSLGSAMVFGPRYAEEIVVMQGSPNTVAISKRYHGVSPGFAGLSIYDSGVERPNADNSTTGGNTIAFGSQPNTLYGFRNETSDYTLSRYTVSASGLALSDSSQNQIYGQSYIITRGDTIFATSGQVVDGTLLQLLGRYSIPGAGFSEAVVIDDATSSVVFAVADKLYVFDRTTFVPTNSLVIPNSGFALKATNCGSPSCVAVYYDSGKIFLISHVDSIFADGFE